MFSVAETNNNTNITLLTTADIQGENKTKTIVICGACGAQERTIDENKTECPHCDDYIY